ncbi:CU044_2847 family protein [Streptomyces wedmorensis]
MRKACLEQITVEFGVDLAFGAGAVITKSQASCHLRVSVSWDRDGAVHSRAGESGSRSR